MHEAARRILVKNVLGVSVHKIQKMGRRILLLTGFDEASMQRALQRVLAAMPEAMPSTGEPMMNVLASFQEGLYQVLVFPRRQHRPEAYFRPGEDRILISPASVDMGGLIITPMAKDFERVEAPLISGIYREVSITPETQRHIISLL